MAAECRVIHIYFGIYSSNVIITMFEYQAADHEKLYSRCCHMILMDQSNFIIHGCLIDQSNFTELVSNWPMDVIIQINLSKVWYA